jgi:hypothetical protein
MMGALAHHLIVVNEDVREKLDGMAYFKGLQPKHRSDVFVLTPQASDETVPHELVHALGLGELAAYPLGRMMVWRYRVLRNLPTLKSLVSSPVEFRKCSGCEEFRLLHERYAGRAEHFIRA